LSAVVGFRREYTADWLDFQGARQFRAEDISVNLLAPRTAGDVLVTLTTEAGFTLDQKLVDNFIESVEGPKGVSPVDVAIGALSLTDLVQQRGTMHVGVTEYELAGGAEGLLLSFVQRKLEEIPEYIQASLLKGIVLTLIELSDNRRKAAGESAAVIASRSEVSEAAITPWLERLTHPRIRLLEKIGLQSYRLPHERLVPVLRRLTGGTLATIDRLQLAFETEYARWSETRSRRHLLGGKELRTILANRDLQGHVGDIPRKAEYLAACVRRRNLLRLGAGGALMAAGAAGYGIRRSWITSVNEQKLMSWRLPKKLLTLQRALDGLDIDDIPINDLTWLRSTRLRNLSIDFTGTSLGGVEELKGLRSLSLGAGNMIGSLTELGALGELTSLSLYLARTELTSLDGLERLRRLTSLDLSLSRSALRLTALSNLSNLSSLSLSIDVPNRVLEDVEQLRQVRSLSLRLGAVSKGLGDDLKRLRALTSLSFSLTTDSQLESMAGELRQLTGLTSLSLRLGLDMGIKWQQQKGYDVVSQTIGRPPQATTLAGLGQLDQLTSLTIGVGVVQVTNLEELSHLSKLTSLTLEGSVNELTPLTPLKGLTSLSIQLAPFRRSVSLAPLGELKRLTSLSLAAYGAEITTLPDLEQAMTLTSLSLDLRNARIKNLQGIEQLKRLTSVSLNLYGSKIETLEELEQLPVLTSVELIVPRSLVPRLTTLRVPREIVTLWIVTEEHLDDVPDGYRFVGLRVLDSR
jgi:hypothetical protein